MPDSQTGVPGRPSEPFVVSFGVVGPSGSAARELAAPADRLWSVVSELRSGHVAAGWARGRRWTQFTVTPGGRQTSASYEDGVVDEDRWRAALADVPGRFERAGLTALPWGEVNLRDPSTEFLGADVASLSGWCRTPAAGVEEAAAALFAELRSAGGRPAVATGFVHVDTVADPYSEVVARPTRLSEDRFDVEVHGYYWAVLLTAGHLDRLGGVTRVRREAPCAAVEDVGRPSGGPAVLCLVTDSPLDLDHERVRAWRRFLAPVLRAGYPEGRENVGVHLTPLGRPLWLFEGEPVPATTRFVLAHGHRPGGRPVPVEWSSTVDDPERPACWLHPGPAAGDADLGAVAAVVRAWFATGAAGRLWGVEGRLHWVSDVTADTDPAGRRGLVWQVDLGDADREGAVGLLAAALGDLGDGTFDVLRVA